jgi:hypothetical protein
MRLAGQFWSRALAIEVRLPGGRRHLNRRRAQPADLTRIVREVLDGWYLGFIPAGHFGAPAWVAVALFGVALLAVPWCCAPAGGAGGGLRRELHRLQARSSALRRYRHAPRRWMLRPVAVVAQLYRLRLCVGVTRPTR